jgi:hypothetical protein
MKATKKERRTLRKSLVSALKLVIIRWEEGVDVVRAVPVLDVKRSSVGDNRGGALRPRPCCLFHDERQ